MKKLLLIIGIIDCILLWLVNVHVVNSMDKDSSNSNLIADNYFMLDKDNYYLEVDYLFVQNTNNYVAKDKQDLLNIIYSVLNNGYESYNFKCSSKYAMCSDDVINIFSDKYILSAINNLVNPYNSYQNINISYLKNGEYNIKVIKLYSNEDIKEINNKINEVSKSIINDNMTLEEQIKAVHDYIINNSVYDIDGLSGKSKYKYNSAYGALIEGHAICTGLSDALSLFLNTLDIPNYKVVSNSHVWNVVYVNNEWLHIDITYDSPLVSYNENIMRYDYYLINTKKLNSLNSKEHDYNKIIYLELM